MVVVVKVVEEEVISGGVGYKSGQGVVVSANVWSVRNGYDSCGNESARHLDS